MGMLSCRHSAGTAALASVALLGACSSSTPGSAPPDPIAHASAGSPTGSLTAGLITDVLLPPDEMPTWNQALTWSAVDLAETTALLGVCALPTLDSLGAVDVAEQEFSTEPGSTLSPEEQEPVLGVNRIARFNDHAAASLAVASLGTAMVQCAPGTYGSGVRSSGPTPGGASIEMWTASTPHVSDEDLTRFDFVGFAVKGAILTTVGFSLSGQDANFEEDPLVGAMTASLARLP